MAIWPLSDDFGQRFIDTFGSRFDPIPAAAGLAPVESHETAANLVRALLGSSIPTIVGSENRILAVQPNRVLVGTRRSPEGQWIPLDELDAALTRLRTNGEVVIHPDDVGYRSAFIGAVLLTLPGARAHGSPPVITLDSPSPDGQEVSPFMGELSFPATVLGRGEQSILRRRLLGNAEVAECALCGRTLPTRFLITAHIKKRTLCTDSERRDLAHVAMAACTLGCDSLFEAGYVCQRTAGSPRGRTVDLPVSGQVGSLPADS